MNNIVDEVDTNNTQVPLSAYNDLSNSVVRLEYESKKATGFLIKFLIKGQQLFTLFTCCHVITQDFVNSKETIVFYYGEKENEIKKYIKLDINERFIKCFEKPIDITIIEIIESDNIPKEKYLIPDLNYKNEGFFNNYLNKKVYLTGYPHAKGIYTEYKNEVFGSSGQITLIYNNYEFEHDLDTREGSSGSPICLINNRCVIGIHKAGDSKEHINMGTFIGIILDELEKEYQKIKNSIKKTEEKESTQFQQIIKIDKTKILKQIERNFTLGSLLSFLEDIAYRFRSNQNLIKKYDQYIDTDTKAIGQIEIQLGLESKSKSFMAMYNECLDEYGYYWFPDNLPKNNIIKDIVEWKRIVPPNLKIYYDNIILLFNGRVNEILFPKIICNNPINASFQKIKNLRIPLNIEEKINLKRDQVKENYLKNNLFDNKLEFSSNNYCYSMLKKHNEFNDFDESNML